MPSIIVTKDGSHSLLNEELNETYHSTHGAIQESQYVFIEKGLKNYKSLHRAQHIRILEIGFGTGLNALLALQYALSEKVGITYHTLEAFPLEADIWKKLNYTSSLGMEEYFEKLHTRPWEGSHNLSSLFNFRKEKILLQDKVLQPASVDVVFFDAFAPSKQPELWTSEILSRVCGTLVPNGVFVTYCAKGQLKRDLKDLGLDVETLPGPPGKKEMVRATQKGVPL